MAYVDKVTLPDGNTYNLGSSVEKVALQVINPDVPITLQDKQVYMNRRENYDGTLGLVDISTTAQRLSDDDISSVQKDAGYDGIEQVILTPNIEAGNPILPGGIVSSDYYPEDHIINDLDDATYRRLYDTNDNLVGFLLEANGNNISGSIGKIINSIKLYIPIGQDLEVNSNGTYTAQATAIVDGNEIPLRTGYKSVTVNVTPTLQNKQVTVNTKGLSYISADAGYDGLDTLTIDTNGIAANLQDREVTITQNKTTVIEKSSAAFDGLGTVTIITNVQNDKIDFDKIFLNSTASIDIPTSKIKTNNARISLYKAFQNASDIDFVQDFSSNDQDINCYKLQSAFYNYKGNGGTILDVLDLHRLKVDNSFGLTNDSVLEETFTRIQVKKLILDLTVTSCRMPKTFGYDYDNYSPIEEIEGVNIKHIDTFPGKDTRVCAATFKQCNKLKSVKTSDPTTDNVWVIRGSTNQMFYGCGLLTSIPEIDKRIVANPIDNDMELMFRNCGALQNVTISITDETGNNTAKTWRAYQMFTNCSSLRNVLGNFDLSRVNNVDDIFTGCTLLESVQTTGSFGGANTNVDSMTLDFSSSSVFDADTFVKSLAANTSGKTRILKLSAASYSGLTEEAISEAADKNYTLQST